MGIAEELGALRINAYICQTCKHQIITRDMAEGVTPFMVGCVCSGCSGSMHSYMYKLDKSLFLRGHGYPTYGWFKYNDLNELLDAESDNVAKLTKLMMSQGMSPSEASMHAYKAYSDMLEQGQLSLRPLTRDEKWESRHLIDDAITKAVILNEEGVRDERPDVSLTQGSTNFVFSGTQTGRWSYQDKQRQSMKRQHRKDRKRKQKLKKDQKRRNK